MPFVSIRFKCNGHANDGVYDLGRAIHTKYKIQYELEWKLRINQAELKADENCRIVECLTNAEYIFPKCVHFSSHFDDRKWISLLQHG